MPTPNTPNPMSSVKAQLDAATTKYETARTKKKKKPNASALEAIYIDAMLIRFPEQPAAKWRVKDLASMKRAFDRVTTHANWVPLMEFIVYEWERIIPSYFGWVKDKPKAPKLSLIVSQIDRFHEAFIDDIDPNREFKAALRKGANKKRQERDTELENEAKALKKELALEKKKTQAAERELQNEKRKTKKLRLKKRKPKKAKDLDLKEWD